MTTSIQKKKSEDVELSHDKTVYLPEMDIFEKGDSILVSCDLPGVDEKDLDVTLEDNVLSITGTQSSCTLEGYEWLRNEYETGVYHRAVTFTQDVDTHKIEAKVKNDVLSVIIPKKKEAKFGKKSIKIKAG